MAQANLSLSETPAAAHRDYLAAEGAMTTRRAFVAAGAAGLSLAIAPAVSASNEDKELIALADQIVPLARRITAVDAEYNAIANEIEALNPKPKALLWRMTDPVRIGDTTKIDGKTYAWCDEHDIEKLRDKRFECWWDSSKIDNKRQGRADELIASLDNWKAERDRLHEKLEQPKRMDEIDALLGRAGPLFNRAKEIRPTTLPGFRAKASIMVAYVWNGQTEEYTASGGRWLQELIDQLVA